MHFRRQTLAHRNLFSTPHIPPPPHGSNPRPAKVLQPETFPSTPHSLTRLLTKYGPGGSAGFCRSGWGSLLGMVLVAILITAVSFYSTSPLNHCSFYNSNAVSITQMHLHVSIYSTCHLNHVELRLGFRDWVVMGDHVCGRGFVPLSSFSRLGSCIYV